LEKSDLNVVKSQHLPSQRYAGEEVCRTDKHISCKLKNRYFNCFFATETIKMMVFVYKYYIL